MKIVFEGINGLLWGLLIIHPLLIPTHSGMSRIGSTFTHRSMIFIYGILAAMLWAQYISKLNEKENRKRDILIHYYPLWVIPAFLLTDRIMIIAIWKLL